MLGLKRRESTCLDCYTTRCNLLSGENPRSSFRFRFIDSRRSSTGEIAGYHSTMISCANSTNTTSLPITTSLVCVQNFYSDFSWKCAVITVTEYLNPSTRSAHEASTLCRCWSCLHVNTTTYVRHTSVLPKRTERPFNWTEDNRDPGVVRPTLLKSFEQDTRSIYSRVWKITSPFMDALIKFFFYKESKIGILPLPFSRDYNFAKFIFCYCKNISLKF